jgi:SM-20-related protein
MVGSSPQSPPRNITMVADLSIEPDAHCRSPGSANTRCPNLVYHNVLGPSTVRELLEYVDARQQDFKPAPIGSRITGECKVDPSLRDCVSLADLGPFKAPIKTFVRRIASTALADLGIIESTVEPREFDISSYGDGGHFGTHIDTAVGLDRVRILSCIYYFSATPRRFSGGELRLYPFPTRSRDHRDSRPFLDVVPEADTLVAFPSWLTHEVLPVRVPSGAWADRRFTINCWIHRARSPAAETPGGT